MSPFAPPPVPPGEPLPGGARRWLTRTRLMWLTAPIWVVLALLGLNLATLDLRAHAGISQAADGRYSSAHNTFKLLDPLSPVEKWRGDYNLATVELLDDNLWASYQSFNRALKDVPDEHRCQVQLNYAILLEEYGDAELDESKLYREWAEQAQWYVDESRPYPDYSEWGDETPAELDRQATDWASSAEADYQLARDLRAECADSDPPTEPDPSADQRLKDKQEQAQQAAGQDEAEDPSEGGLSPEEAEAQRQEELAGRNQDAESQADSDRQEEASQNDDGTSGGSGGNANW